MKDEMLPAIKITLVLTVLTGLIYPFLVTGIAQAIFPWQAHGSLIQAGGKIAGSERIGQKFTKPEYFHGRPSAAGNDGYDAANSGGSNLGPMNPKLLERVKGDAAKFHQENPAYRGAIPDDLLTTSASGLDPHISPAAANAQAERVARARGATVERIRQLIDGNTEDRQWGVLGEPRVNVLKLNLELDRLFPQGR